MLTLNDGRSELWQWDTCRKLTVDADCSQVHFSNKVFGRSIDVDVVDGIAIIPDILLQTDKDFTAWAFVGTPENGYTKISKVFKVNRRNKPSDYVFTPPEQTTLAEIMERIDDLEAIQDPDAIKNAVDDYLANNPIMVKETDPTVPEWAKQPTPPDVKIPDKLPNPHSITFTGAVDASYDGSNPVEIKIPDSGGNVDLTGYATEQFVRDGYQPKGDYLASTELPNAINTALAQAKESGEFDGKDGQDGSDYVLTNADKTEIVETVKAEVPLVKVAEQPSFVSSVDEMTDASKVYVLIPDMSMWAYMKAKSKILTADDFTAGNIGSVGNLTINEITKDGSRLVTTELLSIIDKVVSVNCPEPYQYIVYYFSGNSATDDTYLGKTSFKSGSIDDVTADAIAIGTVSGATHCRISLRDGTNTSANIGGRVDEFMANVTVTQVSKAGPEFQNTGCLYNQPADYEDRIIALEKAWEEMENGNDRLY